MTRTFLERYRAGEEDAVWFDLLKMGDRVRDASVFDDAYAVVSEAMLRSLHNIETIIDRLRGINFVFQSPAPRREPAEDVVRRIDELQSLVGMIPLTIRAFWEIVGGVDLRGHIPRPDKPSFLAAVASRLTGHRAKKELANVEWPAVYSDAMFVHPVDLEAYELWREYVDYDGLDETGPFMIYIAPDKCHKDDASGAGPYEMSLSRCVDSDAWIDGSTMLFIDYLRLCFRWGGFPGFADEPNLSPELRFLSDGLLRI